MDSPAFGTGLCGNDRSFEVAARQAGGVADISLPPLVAEHRSTDGTVKWLFRLGRRAGDRDGIYSRNGSRHALRFVAGWLRRWIARFARRARRASIAISAPKKLLARSVLPFRRCRAGRTASRRSPTWCLWAWASRWPTTATWCRRWSLLSSDYAYGLSRRRITVSTAGLVPNIERLGDDCNVALAVSLHAPDDALRDELVPINRCIRLPSCWMPAGVMRTNTRDGSSRSNTSC